MLMPLFASLQAINLRHNSEAAMFASNQGIMNLANSVTGAETPRQLADIASMEKALRFQGIMAQTNYLAAMAMQEQAQKMQQKEMELKRRLMDAGAIYV